MLLRHWSQVDPLAYYFRGIHQPATRSLAGCHTSTLKTCWKRQDEIYNKATPTFNALMRTESYRMGAFDNFNKEQPKKFITHGKSAIMHIGTVFYLKNNRPLELPLGTKMTSPMGVKFIVTECLPFNADKYLVRWWVATWLLRNRLVPSAPSRTSFERGFSILKSGGMLMSCQAFLRRQMYLHIICRSYRHHTEHGLKKMPLVEK